MASLTKKRGSKYWFACFRDIKGRQCRRSTQETNERRARKIAEQFERVAQRKIKPQKIRETISDLFRDIYGEALPTATVGQFIENWLKTREREIGHRTFESYQKSAAKFLAYLGGDTERDIAEIRQAHITGFRNTIARRVAPCTASFDLKVVRMIFRAARRDGYVLEDPAEFIKGVKRDGDSVRRPFTVGEIQAVLAVADSEWQSLIKFGLYTGQRLADLALLSWANVDLNKDEIRLTARKTGKPMLIPISSPLKKQILSLPPSDDPRAPLHPRSYQTVRNQKRTNTLSNQFAVLLVDAGLREPFDRTSQGKGRGSKRSKNELSFHCLRHTAVSLLKDAGIPEAVVMELVGHDSKEMSKHYTHVGQDALVRAAASFPEI